MSVHGDDGAPGCEHEGDVGGLGADSGEAHEVLSCLGEGFHYNVVEGSVEAVQDLLGDSFEHLASLIIHPGWSDGFGDGLEGGVGDVRGGYSDHLFEAVVGGGSVSAVGVLAQDGSYEGFEWVV